MVTTEIASLQLKDAVDPSNKSGEVQKALGTIHSVLTRQPGYREAWIGYVEEDKHKVHMFINWDSLASHQAFMQTPEYLPTISGLSPLVSQDAQLHHVEFASEAAQKAIFAGPVTEIAIAYAASKDTGHDVMLNETADGMRGKTEGFVDATGGWIIEPVNHPTLEGKDGVGFVELIGWDSVQRHIDWAKSEAGQKAVAGFSAVAKGFDVSHVVIQKL